MSVVKGGVIRVLTLVCSCSVMCGPRHSLDASVEQQAVQRVHRIGQTKECKAYSLIAKATIDEVVVAMQHGKTIVRAACHSTCVVRRSPDTTLGRGRTDSDHVCSGAYWCCEGSGAWRTQGIGAADAACGWGSQRCAAALAFACNANGFRTSRIPGTCVLCDWRWCWLWCWVWC